jgi:hypothetical protein
MNQQIDIHYNNRKEKKSKGEKNAFSTGGKWVIIYP